VSAHRDEEGVGTSRPPGYYILRMFGSRFSGSGRLAIAALLVVLHLGAAAGGPILHGQSEVISSARALEVSHSGECVVIHGEAFCAVTGLHQVVGVTPQKIAISQRATTDVAFHQRITHLPSFRASPGNEVRAPPIA